MGKPLVVVVMIVVDEEGVGKTEWNGWSDDVGKGTCSWNERQQTIYVQTVMMHFDAWMSFDWNACSVCATDQR